jgi:hypothetical protein
MSGTITVQQFLNKVAYDLMEDNYTFPSGLWTTAEVVGYMDYAVGCFINDTGVEVSDNTISSSIGVRSYDRPSDAGDIDRISFNGKRLRRVSSFDLMAKNPNWRAESGTPRFYREDGISITSFELDKKPTKVADIRIFADYLHTDTDPNSLSGTLPLADCWEPTIRWEVLSFCLQKDGESQDLPRAAWAHNKYLYGVSLAQRIMAGEPDKPIPQIEGNAI